MKNTPEVHPGFKDLFDAIGKLQNIVNQVNERVRKAENINKLISISKTITLDDEIVCTLLFIWDWGCVFVFLS